MYEPEVNDRFESIDTLSPDIRSRFSELRSRIHARTVLPWGEHCTECNWPTCYTTCELYSPRADGACRQFIDGMVRIDNPDGLSPYLLKMRFKRWAKLWTVGNLDLCPLPKANRRERAHLAVGAIARSLPVPASLKGRVQRKVSYVRRRSAETAHAAAERPDYFLIECYNPNARTIVLTFTVRLREGLAGPPFQRAVSAAPGYTGAKIPFADIAAGTDLQRPFEVEIVPNDSDDTTLYFGLLDFVKEPSDLRSHSEPQSVAAKWKCIVWDLDNTLWDGILVEDGFEKLRLRQGVVEVIKATDQRGILHSIASKNNPSEAMKVLRMFGLEEYFLHPQISWQPKSQSIVQIAHRLNIGAETLAFVDDQEFEREEVRAALPQVVTIDAAHYATIPDRVECRVPVTDESRNRRLMYREQQHRQETEIAYAGDYPRFLRDCQLVISMATLDDTNLERVYELAQRTNQMNFSDNRYPRERLKEIMGTGFLGTHVMRCTDRFGSYGIVGFAVVDTREPRLLDLMFSCRIQGKRVEHAFLSFLLQRFVAGKALDFFANYRMTPKNKPAGKVFAEMGFELVAENNGVQSLVFRQGREIPDDKIIVLREGAPE